MAGVFAGRSRTNLVKVAVPTVPPQDTALLALTSSALVIIVLVLLALSIIYCKRFWKSQCQRGESMPAVLLLLLPLLVTRARGPFSLCRALPRALLLLQHTVTQTFLCSCRINASTCFLNLQDLSCALPAQRHGAASLLLSTRIWRRMLFHSQNWRSSLPGVSGRWAEAEWLLAGQGRRAGEGRGQ